MHRTLAITVIACLASSPVWAQPAPAPLNLTGTAPITVTPSGPGNTPRVVACPTCGTGGITQLTGDVTAGPGSGSQAATLAPSGATAGSYGRATITVDAKGRVTSAASNSPTNVAVNSALGGIYVTARFYSPFNVGNSSPNGAFTANVLYACPFVAMNAATITSLVADLSSFTTAGSARLGLYADNGAMTPGTLVAGSDTGTIAVAATGAVTAPISSAIAQGSLYWLAFMQSVSIGNWVYQATAQGVNAIMGAPTALAAYSAEGPCVSNPQTFGAMPATFPTGTFSRAVISPGMAFGF